MISIPAVLASSLWIAVCAAAPEFIWQGMTIAIGHSDWTTIVAALLVGAILAFFVEPLMESARRLSHGHEAARRHAGDAFFTVLLSIAFAVVSVFLHDAITSAVSGGETALRDALALTLGWAWTPFAVSLAWLTRGRRWLGAATAVCAVLSPLIVCWVFSWSWQSAVTGFVPTVLIMAISLRPAERGVAGFARLAWIVGVVSVLWLVFAAALSPVAPLYSAADLWVDARFYLGWVIGLLVAPDPLRR